MKKTLLTLLAPFALALGAYADTPVKAWYKVWITPERCITGITTLSHDATDDSYTASPGLGGSEIYPFKFGFDTSDSSEKLKVYGSVYDETKEEWSADDWFSDGSYVGTYINGDDEWMDFCCGQYYSLSGSKPGAGTGALYGYMDACTADYSYAYNYYSQPVLVWPAVEPVSVQKGTYTCARTGETRECEMWNYTGGTSVIKAYNGIAGYDICFKPQANTIISDNFMPDAYDPTDYTTYNYMVYDRLPGDDDNNLAKVMMVKSVTADVIARTVSFAYNYVNYNVYTSAISGDPIQSDCTDTFAWEEEATSISSTVADRAEGPVEWYSPTGARVPASTRGLVLRKQGGRVVKVVR